jgi:hypothetical protein
MKQNICIIQSCLQVASNSRWNRFLQPQRNKLQIPWIESCQSSAFFEKSLFCAVCIILNIFQSTLNQRNHLSLPSEHSVQRDACCSEALLQLPYSVGLPDLAPKKKKQLLFTSLLCMLPFLPLKCIPWIVPITFWILIYMSLHPLWIMMSVHKTSESCPRT